MLKTDKQHADDIRLKCLELALNQSFPGPRKLELGCKVSQLLEDYVHGRYDPLSPSDINRANRLFGDQFNQKWVESFFSKTEEEEDISESQ